jgi:hypothetical protein
MPAGIQPSRQSSVENDRKKALLHPNKYFQDDSGDSTEDIKHDAISGGPHKDVHHDVGNTTSPCVLRGYLA